MSVSFDISGFNNHTHNPMISLAFTIANQLLLRLELFNPLACLCMVQPIGHLNELITCSKGLDCSLLLLVWSETLLKLKEKYGLFSLNR
ncbi:hypothetical protein AQUCO_07200011v1 [Aquilegia coerulea]|uniref:Uncharacterized protein n=1 Tax=Aquilegia coerulea TaxID=218851 RepID=A0A2G5C9X7_AQUCA|nr:hypothetical protein AQUCO_07200011v1 [Aquilegia coerulea]